MKIRSLLLLAFFLFLGIAIRLNFLVYSSDVIGADGFFHKFIVGEILSSGTFPNEDPFSWQGREINYFPGLHLFSAALLLSTGLSPSIVSLIPLLLFVVAFFFVYAVARKLQLPEYLACGIFSTIPIISWKTTANFLPDSLWVPLFIACAFLLSSQARAFGPLAISLLAGVLIHPMMFVAFLPSILSLRSRRRLLNFAILGTVCLAVYLAFGFETPVLSTSGAFPPELHSQIFEEPTIAKVLARIGPGLVAAILAFPLGAIGTLAPLSLSLLRFVELDRLILISSLFAIFPAATFLSKRRKFAQMAVVAFSVLWVIMQQSALSWAPLYENDYSALHWVEENTKGNTTVFSSPGDGYLVGYVSGRKNFLDGHFSGRTDVKARLNALSSVMANPSAASYIQPPVFFLMTRRSFSGDTFGNGLSREWTPLFVSDSSSVLVYN